MTTLRQFESTGSEADAAADAPAPVARGSNVRAVHFQEQLVAAEARLRQSDVRTEPLQAGKTFADEYQRAGYMYDPAHSNTYDQVRKLCCGWVRTRRWCMWITGTGVSAAGRRVAPADGDADTDIVTIDKDFSVRQGVMNSQDSEDRDDGIGLVTGDDYERFRLLMNLRTLTKSSRRYGQIQQTLELARLLCMGAATGASLFGHPEYVVVALAVVGVCPRSRRCWAASSAWRCSSRRYRNCTASASGGTASRRSSDACCNTESASSRTRRACC